MTVPIPAGRFLMLHMLPVFQDVSVLPYLLQTVNCIFPSYADVLGTAPYSVRRNKDSSSPVSVFLSHHPYRLRAMDSTGRIGLIKRKMQTVFFIQSARKVLCISTGFPFITPNITFFSKKFPVKFLHSDCSAHIKSGRLFYNPSVDSFFRLLRSVPRSGVIRFGYFRRIPTIAQSLTTTSTVVCRSLHQLSTFASSSSVVFNISSRIYVYASVMEIFSLCAFFHHFKQTPLLWKQQMAELISYIQSVWGDI